MPDSEASRSILARQRAHVDPFNVDVARDTVACILGPSLKVGTADFLSITLPIFRTDQVLRSSTFCACKPPTWGTTHRVPVDDRLEAILWLGRHLARHKVVELGGGEEHILERKKGFRRCVSPSTQSPALTNALLAERTPLLGFQLLLERTDLSLKQDLSRGHLASLPSTLRASIATEPDAPPWAKR